MHMLLHPGRDSVIKDPGWRDFLRDSTGLLDELHSTIMLPAPHSPLKRSMPPPLSNAN